MENAAGPAMWNHLSHRECPGCTASDVQYGAMQRATSSTLLILCFFLAASAQGQRGVGVGMSRGLAPRFGHFGGDIIFRQRGLFSRHPHFRQFQNVGSVPLWYGDPFGYDPYPNVEPVVNAPVPPAIVQQEQHQSSTATPAATPKLIEVPGSSDTAKAKPLPPQTADNLYVTIDRQKRTIPLAMLDIKATLDANQKRGIDLRIPADQNEITLAF